MEGYSSYDQWQPPSDPWSGWDFWSGWGYGSDASSWEATAPSAPSSEQAAQTITPPSLNDPNFGTTILNNGLSSEFPPGFFGPVQSLVDNPANFIPVPGGALSNGFVGWLINPTKAY